MAGEKAGPRHTAPGSNYYKEIFFDSDTVMAMITGAVIGKKEHFALPTEEMVKTRNLMNEAAGSQRMLSHGSATRRWTTRSKTSSSRSGNSASMR